jgi:hypothetical protein
VEAHQYGNGNSFRIRHNSYNFHQRQ